MQSRWQNQGKWLNVSRKPDAIRYRLYRRFASALRYPSEIDGRLIVLAIVVAYFVSIAASSLFTDYRHFWGKYLGVPAFDRLFLDLRQLAAGAVCSEQGYDPLVSNPCDIQRRPYNYPRIWISFTNAIGLSDDTVVLVGVCLALLFIAAALLILGRLTTIEALIAAAAVCSPPVMMGVERGNNDLVVFSIIALGLWLSRTGRDRSSVSVYSAVFAASVLKLYPSASFFLCLREPTRKRALGVFSILCLLFGFYLYWSRDDIFRLLVNTEKSAYFSFGRNVSVFLVAKAWFAQKIPTTLLKAVSYAGLLAMGMAGVWASRRVSVGKQVESAHLDAFRIGATIYILAFSVSVSWDYRLVFLLFTIPQTLAWVKSGTQWGGISAAAIVILLVALWSAPWSYQLDGVDELFNWLLFGYFVVGMTITLPSFLRVPIV